MVKKALLIISFGSSYERARKTLKNIEHYLGNKYREYDLFTAYTSRFIVKKLKKLGNKDVLLPMEALEKMHALGYKEVICQSLHVINGIEYEMTVGDIKQFESRFNSLSLGKPLLTTEEDYELIVDIIKDHRTLQEQQGLLLMGHGSEHFSNASYSMLQQMFEYKGLENIFVATVEGFPELDFAITKMRKRGIRKVMLMPFMIVAGDHATNDMAGDDDDSWKTILLEDGFEVECILEGLGDIEAIQELFYKHLEESRN